MPSGLTVHRVLIAPRDSILQNVETVIQCSTWPLHHWRSPRGIQTHRFFISREIYCIEQLRLYSAEDCDVMLQWTFVLDLEFDDGRRTVELLSWLQITELHVTLCFTQPQDSSLRLDVSVIILQEVDIRS
ncbi:hypothetical protein TNCV_4548081 [Trichonephila clavipes]|nr:hypothetical protein TNCV_4548081 [Trichonephila clavipes]